MPSEKFTDFLAKTEIGDILMKATEVPRAGRPACRREKKCADFLAESERGGNLMTAPRSLPRGGRRKKTRRPLAKAERRAKVNGVTDASPREALWKSGSAI